MALVVADGASRRKKERTLYKRRITELERETERLKAFEEHDAPAFARWLDSEFASEMLRFREAVARISELEQLENQVRTYAHLQQVPLWQAYRDVKAAREVGKVDELFGFGRNSRTEEDEPRGWPQSREDEDDDDELFGAFRDFAREVFGIDVDEDEESGPRNPFDDDERGEHCGPGWDARQSSREQPIQRSGDSYLKGLYRPLVRALHPDAGAEMTPERQLLWAEVQDAYSWGDVHRLQKLHARVCGGDASAVASLDFATMPIGDIMGLRKPIDRRLREIRSKLRVAKKELCWGFWTLRVQGGKALAKVRATVARDLTQDLSAALRHKTGLERLVESWESGPKLKAPGSGGGDAARRKWERRRHASNDEFRES